ncbi:putative LysM domain-containing protein [Medicago truncatula]|uniref:Carbohydrate-binding module family protein n=1 Tax=Medicago truncatula TaxID=3880 RepID=G7JRT4_MEDTR|nr:carbohydrate-binding module family protein [Medicago truncatula]RHN62507.1 putative LysM domain-containing protein [Medicago truncatula]
MTKSSSSSFALVLSFLLITMFSTAPTAGFPICSTIHGVQVGETCFSIIQKFAIEQPLFLRLNPNINCSGIFVGQWVCVNGR